MLQDNERDVKILVDRAEHERDKKGATRRDALRRLISAAHSPNPALKKLAATKIHSFICDFPDLEDEAINAVYDLCEDQITQIRLAGYNAITNVSQVQTKWIKRNADVLVQLLQSDEDEEVRVVKKGLWAHLDMDPVATLNVLQDQIKPPDHDLDEEEQAARGRLRRLVLTFLCDDAKAAVKRHVLPGSPAEQVLISGLIKAIPRLSSSDTEIVVNDLLLYLPSFTPQCQLSTNGNQVVHVLLQTIKVSLNPNPNTSSGSPDWPAIPESYLKLVHRLVLERKAAEAPLLVRFCCETLLQRPALEKLNPAATKQLGITVMEALEASLQPPSQPREKINELRRKIAVAAPVLLKSLPIMEDTGSRRVVWLLLENSISVFGHQQNSFERTQSSDLLDVLRTMQSSVEAKNDSMDTMEDDYLSKIKVSLKTLLPSKPVSIKRKADEIAGPAPPSGPRERGTAARRNLQTDTPAPVKQEADEAGASIKRQRRNNDLSNVRSKQETSVSAPSTPSLLSRLGGTPAAASSAPLHGSGSGQQLRIKGRNSEAGSSTSSQRLARSNVTGLKATLSMSDIERVQKDTQGGFKIKGAAASGEDGAKEVRSPASVSLLERLGSGASVKSDERGGGAGGKGGKRRK